MKLSDIQGRILSSKELQEIDAEALGYKELIDVPTAESIELTFPDGTKILVFNSEWMNIYIKEPS